MRLPLAFLVCGQVAAVPSGSRSGIGRVSTRSPMLTVYRSLVPEVLVIVFGRARTSQITGRSNHGIIRYVDGTALLHAKLASSPGGLVGADGVRGSTDGRRPLTEGPTVDFPPSLLLGPLPNDAVNLTNEARPANQSRSSGQCRKDRKGLPADE